MNPTAHIDHLLQDYLDGMLPSEDQAAVEAHLTSCAACRADYEALRRVFDQVAALPTRIEPPADLWPGIAGRLQHPPAGSPNGLAPAVDRSALHRLPQRRRWRWPVVTGVVALAVAACLLWLLPRLLTPAWTIAPLDGTPRIGATELQAPGRLRPGQWLETAEGERASLDVGAIGSVEVRPNTRLQLLSAQPTNHRLALASGSIHARIWAPPRLFFVETPSALAIDLGCEYTLDVEDDGSSLLYVTAGYVALEHDERSVVVPAGYQCRTRPGQGPGTPFQADASPAFQEALAWFDFEDGGPEALTALLAAATEADGVTLLDLLPRLKEPERSRLVDHLLTLTSVPDGVTREGVLRGNPAMIEAWREHLDNEIYRSWLFRYSRKKAKQREPAPVSDNGRPTTEN